MRRGRKPGYNGAEKQPAGVTSTRRHIPFDILPPWSVHPQLAAFLAAIQHGDEAAAEAAADWLQDHDATLTDVILWYAPPPCWLRKTHAEDEAVRAILWRWLRNVEPGQDVIALPEKDVIHDGWPKGRRWEWVKMPWEWQTDNILYREDRQRMKWTILSAFADIQWKAFCEVSQTEFPSPPVINSTLAGFFLQNGFRIDGALARRVVRKQDRESRRWVYTQTLAAPEWIPHDCEVSGFPDAILMAMRQYGINLNTISAINEVSADNFRSHHRGIIYCNCRNRHLIVAFREVPVQRQDVMFQVIEMHCETLRQNIGTYGYHDTLYWFGQCRECRTLYWARRE